MNNNSGLYSGLPIALTDKTIEEIQYRIPTFFPVTLPDKTVLVRFDLSDSGYLQGELCIDDLSEYFSWSDIK